MGQTKTGKCLCGAVKFTARDIGETFGACHCKMCQRWAGSALLAVMVSADALEIEDEAPIRRRQTSDWAERAWCNECGSGLWYRVTMPGPHQGQYHVALGLFDDHEGLRLTQEIFTDRRSTAFRFAGDLEGMTEAEVMAMFAGDAP